MNLLNKIPVLILKLFAMLFLLVGMLSAVTGVSPIYDFAGPKPFSGKDIFNPYRNLDTAICWKRANFHTHTKVKSIFNECQHTPRQVYDSLARFGYDIVTFSNHNELTKHPFDKNLQVNVYEHGYNIFKYHKLVFGAEKVFHFDNLFPIFDSQWQFQLDYLNARADFIQLNHPFRTIGINPRKMRRLTGYRIMELDSGMTTEQEYWDWALSAGHYSFGLANDDLHYPHKTYCIAVRCNFLCTPSGSYEDLKKTLLDGCYYSMRVPDYGGGNWKIKHEGNANLPKINDIGLRDTTIYMTLSQVADSIKVTGQNGKILSKVTNADTHEYHIRPQDTYARLTAYFAGGEVIYTNPFARYDSTKSDSPYVEAPHPINVFKTILYNFALLLLMALFAVGIVKTVKK